MLKFTRKRAAPMVSQVLKAAMADADEHQADVGMLYIKEARADEAGIRIGTKRWIAEGPGPSPSNSQKGVPHPCDGQPGVRRAQ